MATERQNTAVKELSENIGNGKSMGEIMKVAGYSKITAKTPQRLTESKGFKQLCNEAGLTDNMILRALAEDIKQKPRDRSKELAIACKVKGLYRIDNEQQQKSIDIQDCDFVEIIRAYKINKVDNGSTKAIQGEIVG
jgi:hypothetical protein